MKKRALILLLASLLSGCVDVPQPHRRAPVRTATPFHPAPGAQACLTNLGRSDANFTPLPDQYFGAGCSTLNTVRLAWLKSDDSRLQLSNLGPVTCPLATALSGWARFGVDRAARQMLGSPLVRIETMGSYSCRTVAGTARLSAHATANAIDIAAFHLADGRRISVTNGWNADSASERAFLHVVRDSACKRFGTVLSPDYNAAHRDHLHLETSPTRPLCR
jgi:hypothetical protein